MQFRNIIVDPPNEGKFLAFFNDGSGANLFFIDDSGDIYDCQLEPREREYLESCYNLWIKMPDDFEYFFEVRQKQD